MSDPRYTARIKAEQLQNRAFLDALRECLGLDPLYTQKRSVPGQSVSLYRQGRTAGVGLYATMEE